MKCFQSRDVSWRYQVHRKDHLILGEDWFWALYSLKGKEHFGQEASSLPGGQYMLQGCFCTSDRVGSLRRRLCLSFSPLSFPSSQLAEQDDQSPQSPQSPKNMDVLCWNCDHPTWTSDKWLASDIAYAQGWRLLETFTRKVRTGGSAGPCLEIVPVVSACVVAVRSSCFPFSKQKWLWIFDMSLARVIFSTFYNTFYMNVNKGPIFKICCFTQPVGSAELLISMG